MTRRRARVIATDPCAGLLSYNTILYTSIEVCVATDGTRRPHVGVRRDNRYVIQLS